MDPRWLEAFIALAETHSIRAGAARLSISPATLSDRMSALETYLGVPLMDRTASGSELTERGRLYYSDAIRLLKEWERITGQLKELDDVTTGNLRMVFPGQTMPPQIETFLHSFLSRHYHIVPEMFSDREFGIQAGLRDGRVDLYFAFCPPQIEFPDILHKTVFQTRLCAVVSCEHSLAHRESISLSELDGETLFLSPETKAPYLRYREIEALHAARIQYNVKEGNIIPKLQSILVELNRGVSILPHNLCFANQGKTTILPLTDPLCRCSVEMLYMPENKNPALRLFLEEFSRREEGVQDDT